MLPPPTTRPSCTPVADTCTSSLASRSMTPKSIPERSPPARASPDLFSRARGYASWPTLLAPELEAREATHLDLLAGLGRERPDQIADGLLVVLDERLLQQHVLLIELLQHALNDLGPDVLRLLLLDHLRLVDAPLPLDHLGRQVLHAHGDRPGRGDLQRHVLGEGAEIVGPRDEVRLAVQLHQHADLAVEVDVGLDQAFARRLGRPLLGLAGVLDPQDLFRLGHVAAGFLQRLLAVHHAGARLGTQLRHEFRGNLFHDRHLRSLLIRTPPPCRLARRAAKSVERITTLPGMGLGLAPCRWLSRWLRRWRVLRLEPRRDRFGLGPPFAARRTLLPVALRLRLDPGFGRIRHGLRVLGGIAHRLLAPRLRDHLRDRHREQRDRADRVVVPGDRHGDQVRIGVGVHDGHHRDPQLVRLGDRNPLLLRVDHEQRARQPPHLLDARQILVELHALPVQQQLFLLRVVLELPFRRSLLQVLQPLDLLLDRLEVGERSAQPALGDPEAAGALRLTLDDELELLLGADEQDALAAQHDLPQQLLRLLELPQRLLEIDDVDPGAFGEDEPAHLRIPPPRLVAEMHTGFQQILHLRMRHARPFSGFGPPPPSSSKPPCNAGTQLQIGRREYLNCAIGYRLSASGYP